MKHRLFLIVTVVSLALTTLDVFATADENGPKIGDVPPEIAFSEMVQGMHTNEVSWSRLRGKVVVLEFWATWCAPCVKAVPHLKRLVDEFKDQPVVFLSVTSEPAEKIRKFLISHPMRASIGLDTDEAVKLLSNGPEDRPWGGHRRSDGITSRLIQCGRSTYHKSKKSTGAHPRASLPVLGRKYLKRWGGFRIR